MDVIQVDDLVKCFGALAAVDGVSFSVQQGEVFGFLGPNGVGKSTTISILCTLVQLTSGRVCVNGFDVVRQPDKVRHSIGIVFQEPSLDVQLTALENLDFAAGGSTQAVFQSCIVLLLAPLIGVPLTPLLVVQMIVLMFFLAFAMTSLGIAVASRVQTLEGFGVVVNLLAMPLFFLSGALFPLVAIPAWLSVLTRLDPATYGVDPLRRGVLLTAGAPPAAVAAIGVDIFGHKLGTTEEIVILLVFALVMLTLAAHWFENLQ